MNEFRIADMGSVTFGETETTDLIPIFLDTLKELGNSDYRAFQSEWDSINSDDNMTDVDTRLSDIDSLFVGVFDALEEHSPPYCTFRRIETGDGACFGFFPCADWQQCMEDDGVEFVNDLSEIATREVCHINDHGNVTFGYVDSDGFHETWSIV